MADTKKVYLPKMRTRPGFTHSYQSKPGIEVVTVDENGPVQPERESARRRPVSRER